MRVSDRDLIGSRRTGVAEMTTRTEEPRMLKNDCPAVWSESRSPNLEQRQGRLRRLMRLQRLQADLEQGIQVEEALINEEAPITDGELELALEQIQNDVQLVVTQYPPSWTATAGRFNRTIWL